MVKEFLNKSVRINEDSIMYYLNESHLCFEHPSEIYDNMIEVMLLMGMFENEFPGNIVGRSPTSGNYLVHFYTGFSAFFNPENVIFED